MTPLDRLILSASRPDEDPVRVHPLDHASVEDVRRMLGLGPGAFFDHFARRVALAFDAGEIGFVQADAAMNALDAYCLDHYDVTLPPYAREVYGAFDEGEYRHDGDDAGVDPVEKYTRPAIRDILARDHSLGLAESHPGMAAAALLPAGRPR